MEERTQAPTKRQRQKARERGLVARSPELTAAVGVLAGVVLLGAWGGRLGEALAVLVHEAFATDPTTAGDLAAVVWAVRHAAAAVAGPLGMIVGGVAAAMVAAHQAQVGGLWAPALLAPDVSRLGPGGGSWLARSGRGAWGLARGGIGLGVALWAIRANLPRLDRLAALDPPRLAVAVAALLRGLVSSLGLALLGLGLADFALQWRRVEDRLSLTPEEHREEQKAIEGDPAIRARRSRVARARRLDARGAVAGAALVVTGPGVAVVLGGGPPPRKVLVRAAARGGEAGPLLREAKRAGLDVADAPRLALHFARAAAAGRVLPPELAGELRAIWPVG